MHNYAPTGILTQGSGNPLAIRQGLRVLCQISRPVDIQTGPLPLPCRYLVLAGTFPQVARPTLVLRPDVVKGAGRGLLRGVVTHPGVSQIAERERPSGAPAMRVTARRSSNSGRVLCSCRLGGQGVRHQGGVTPPYCRQCLYVAAEGRRGTRGSYSRGMIAQNPAFVAPIGRRSVASVSISVARAGDGQ